MRISDWSSDVCSSDLGASFTEPISLVGAKGDPLLDGDEPLTLAEIVDLPLIIAGIRKEGIRDIVERAFADVGLTPNNVVAEVETTLMARPMVARKLGYPISLASAAEQGIRAGSLAVRPTEAVRLEGLLARAVGATTVPAAPYEIGRAPRSKR